MAKRTPPKPRRPAKPARPSRPKKAKPAPRQKEEAAPKPGMPVESALAVATAVLLLLAIVLVFWEKGVHYGDGPFAGQYTGAESE